MKVYAFDVDHTLICSSGPIGIDAVWALREEGHITGLCGNWAVVTSTVKGWHKVFSFLGPLSMTKGEFLRHIAQYVRADEYVMVGNDPGNTPPGLIAISNDSGAARDAGWRFILERDFAAGAR